MPAMGVRGAAVATVATRVVELLIVWVFTFSIQKKLDIKPRDLLKIDRTLAADYGRYGLPVGLTDMQWALIGMLKAAIIGQMGAAFMAANNIATSMANLGTMFTFALAGGACVVVGKAAGKGDYDTARAYSKTIQIMFFGIGLVMAGLVFLLKVPFTKMYGSSADPEVFDLSVQMISLLAVTLIGTSYHASCFVGINRGAGDSRFVMIVDMICGWLVVLPATLLAAFVFHAPLPIVFLCTRIDQCFKWLIAFIRLRGNKWIKNVTSQLQKGPDSPSES
jgi:Na+-driven multidrug efflux pump